MFAYRRLLALACATAALAFAAPASADPLANLQTRAIEAQLDRDPVWQLLLSYDPNDVGLLKRSSATSSGFFLSPRGHRDPKAELEALAHQSERAQQFMKEMTIIKTIVVPNKLVNIVVKAL